LKSIGRRKAGGRQAEGRRKAGGRQAEGRRKAGSASSWLNMNGDNMKFWICKSIQQLNMIGCATHAKLPRYN
jgi:hypothetical protein